MSIRNVSQTAQERTVVKTAPDIVVFLEGLPFLLNPYINSANGLNYTLVSFNDHVASFSSAYDVDNLIPSASFNLSVPNNLRYLYQAPGGNNIIESMMEVQVFAKGYYLSPRGNTVYHRIFKGLTSHISWADNGVSLEIMVQCQGSLYFLERMQIDLSPSLLSNSERPATPYLGNQANMDPYEILADTFLRGITFEGFQLNSLIQAKVKNSDFGGAVAAGYAVKWQAILDAIRKDVHIFGYTFGSVLPQDINGVGTKSQAQGKESPAYRPVKNDVYGNKSPIDPKHDWYVNIIRGYLPDMGIGTINLLNGRIVSRLERIRTVVQMIGFEGYQDINGEIIIKPPLYNLDVTNLGSSKSTTNYSNTSTSRSDSDNLFEENNPFVVNLDEIETEAENEDEKAVLATRMSIQPNWLKNLQFADGTNHLRAVVSHIDIPKLTKFGLREQPARTIAWLNNDDKWAAYAYAVAELVRANRGFRQYNFTIPLRPELKLGFPMYLPHKDMYGYIKTISITYQQGGKAVMGVTLDTIRKRPMFPSTHTIPNTNDPQTNQPKKVTVYTTQPNLVMRWTTPPSQQSGQPVSGGGQISTDAAAAELQVDNQSKTFSRLATGGSTGDACSSDPRVNLVGNPATQLQSKQKPIFDEELRVISNRRNQLGTSWGTKADTTSKSFRIQNDTLEASDKSAGLTGKTFFSADNWINTRDAVDGKGNPIFIRDANGNTTPNKQQTSGIDMRYLQKVLVSQPYTDEKGYEVVTPFPWGRWKDLRTAIRETREGRIVETPNPNQQEILTGANTFLFAGTGVGMPSLEPGSALLTALQQLNNAVRQDDSFELEYPGPNQPGGDNSILNTNQPEDIPGSDRSLVAATEANLQQKVDVFVSGTPQPTPLTQADITNIQNFQGVGVTPPDQPEQQSILEKPGGGTI